MSDADFLLRVLSDGEWHSHTSILDQSIRERGVGMTVHSRAATLRSRGYVVECSMRPNGKGRACSFYRLAGALEDAAAVSPSSLRTANAASSSASVYPGSPLHDDAQAVGAADAFIVSPQPGDASGEDALSSQPCDSGVASQTPGVLSLFDQPRGAYGDAA